MRRYGPRGREISAGCAIAASLLGNQSTGVVMTWIARIATAAVAAGVLAWPLLMSEAALAQAPSELTNSKIEFAYFRPRP